MRRELLLLVEMRDAAVQIRQLVNGLDADMIDTDPMRRSALLWQFTVLGEAANQPIRFLPRSKTPIRRLRGELRPGCETGLFMDIGTLTSRRLWPRPLTTFLR